MPQLDLFFWKSNITLVFLFFLYFYLFVSNYLMVEIIKILSYRKFRMKQLRRNSLYIKQCINVMEKGLVYEKFTKAINKLHNYIFKYNLIANNYDFYISLLLNNKTNYFKKKKSLINFFFIYEFLYFKNNMIKIFNEKSKKFF